ncbi:leukocyte immunoglobulin-like receptor subfamily A member 5 [Trichosurus vulpecula]|uniref:leukocyte immunoglobulin-like receptor subfamily A member 5 n=1 Tax=Trichosurus vulpecula TaxID=9337 RepID=UPI00186B561F|nr:leukocyte immunoglobulin-like receptor subfamily A member 5 [Trichosurus vulpecula]
MTPIFSALLSLETFPKPSLRAENGSLVPLGRNVTLTCQGSVQADDYRLEKDQGSRRIPIMAVKPSGIEGKFHIPSVTANCAGTYYCLYRHSSNWSGSSDPLELVVTGPYEPPSLSALPSSVVASGHNVTLQCQSQRWYDTFALYKDGEQISSSLAQQHVRGSWANFSMPAVTTTHEGTYQCYSFHSYYPYVWSAPSDVLVLRVTGTFSPSPESGNMQFDPAPQDYTVGNLIRLSLAGLVLLLLGVLLAEAWHSQRGPLNTLPSSQVASGHNVTLQCQSQRGYDMYALYKDGERFTQVMAQAHGTGALANFSMPAVTAAHKGTYQCYSFHSNFPYEWSAPSGPLVLRVTGEEAPAPPTPPIPPKPHHWPWGTTLLAQGTPPGDHGGQEAQREGMENLGNGSCSESTDSEDSPPGPSRLPHHLPHAQEAPQPAFPHHTAKAGTGEGGLCFPHPIPGCPSDEGGALQIPSPPSL